MSKQENIILNGTIVDVFKGDNFQVEVSGNESHKVLCKPSGAIRINNIKLLTGDSVRIEVSPYDLSKGRIIFRELTKR